MRFKDALWDGSEPDYAPCMARAGKYFYWVAQKKYADMGYEPKRERLPGKLGDGNDLERAAKARELTRAMIDFYAAEDEPTVQIGTWEWLMLRYTTDPESPYQEIVSSTQADYDRLIGIWIAAIGTTLVSETNFKSIKRWERAMANNGRSRDHISRMFTMMRTVIGYGVMIEAPGCLRVKEILSEMRFKKGKTKDTSGTPEQVQAVIDAAIADKAHAFALGCQLQWWFSMRAVDVRGQWQTLKPGEERAGIIRGDKRWSDGLTWDMIDRDVASITKTLSKTKDTTGKTLSYDLTLVPEIREALMATPTEKRVGPVIVSPRSGLPYTKDGWGIAWRRYRKAAGVPDHVKNMGIRPTALTHGERAGASAFQLRDMAGHSDIKTTNRYIRDADEAAAKVVEMRRKA